MGEGLICATCGEAFDAAACPSCASEGLLDGRYRLEQILGRGASGITYRATELRSGLSFAVKELPFGRARDLKAFELIHREARVLSELDHPGIPKYWEHFEWGTGKQRALYIVQERIVGESLLQELERRRYSASEVIEVLDELAAILDYLASRSPPVIHRDLKPGNVLKRRSDGRLVLIDFGSVRDLLRETLLGGSTVAGTFGYMAPEQLRGVATPSTDLYGLGALAVALLARRDPAELLDTRGRLHWRQAVTVEAPLAQLLDGLLASTPEGRTASARVLRATLAKLKGGQSLPAQSEAGDSALEGWDPAAEYQRLRHHPVPERVRRYNRMVSLHHLRNAGKARAAGMANPHGMLGRRLRMLLGAGIAGTLGASAMAKILAGAPFAWVFVLGTLIATLDVLINAWPVREVRAPEPQHAGVEPLAGDHRRDRALGDRGNDG